MCYTIIPTPRFEEDIKYYMNKKKFTKIDSDLDPVIIELEKGNFVGASMNDIKIQSPHHTYKVRVANSNTRSGQSNGYRLIYYVVKDEKEIYLLTVYYKKDDNNIPSKFEIASIINQYCL
jgi:mRNA-degrading endonuclease RelE of RelBE toxin-antitoxin system